MTYLDYSQLVCFFRLEACARALSLLRLQIHASQVFSPLSSGTYAESIELKTTIVEDSGAMINLSLEPAPEICIETGEHLRVQIIGLRTVGTEGKTFDGKMPAKRLCTPDKTYEAEGIEPTLLRATQQINDACGWSK